MKIAKSFDSYNIESLEDIERIVSEIGQQIPILENVGNFLKGKIISCADEFTSVNYERVKDAIESYLTKLNIFREEIIELVVSCKYFVDVIYRKWGK